MVHPQDPAEQKASYRGKKKDHTEKNVLLVNALLLILFLSDPMAGTHGKRHYHTTPYPLPGEPGVAGPGLLAFTRCPEVAILMPRKKPRGGELSLEEGKGEPGTSPASTPDDMSIVVSSAVAW